MNSYISKNYLEVFHNVEETAKASSRKINEVTLIAVSKTKPVEMLKEAYDAGARDFGENKVQEIMDKYDKLPADIRWHMIGHLQTNKVKYIADKVFMIHSVDSVKLAKEISKQAVKAGRTIPILIEVNIAGEDSKFGVSPAECEQLICAIHTLPGIRINGLMTVPPYVENAEDNRQYFRALKQLSVDIMQKNIDNVYMDFLSMGMSGDYTVAIAEGANLVRVGTNIFGERDYSVQT